MGIRLTDKLIAELAAPAQGNRIYYDAPNAKGGDWISGFGVRITASGQRSFIYNYRTRGGRERRITIGSPPAWNVVAARKAAGDLRRNIDMGDDPMADRVKERDAETVKDLAEMFEVEHLRHKRPRTVTEYKAIIKTEILPAIGALKVADEGLFEDIGRLHRKISQRAPCRANRALAVLSVMFTLAIKKRLRKDNPCVGIQHNEETPRERYLTDAELTALVSALDAHKDQRAADIFRILLLTGARRGEVTGAEWSHFDLAAGVWTKPAALMKNKKAHRVPLSEAALDLFKQIHAKAGDLPFVFPSRDRHLNDVRRAWVAICAAAGIKGLRMHDLRHNYASLLVNSGMSLAIIGRLIGHANQASTARYAHLQDHVLREATGLVGRMVTAAKGRGGKVVPLRGGNEGGACCRLYMKVLTVSESVA